MLNAQSGFRTYYVYILTNKHRSTFYIGVTNNLKRRLSEHKANIQNRDKTFVAKYNIEFLIYYEKFNWIQEAIAREKALKGWKRDRKIELVKAFNPTFDFLNHFE
ncbi:GIY-YIG nuclease family protein [Flavobacterium sp. HTF]|uniref:GIY-YIG nuclease family protein n=1 Tax=Flavobacterium sp. HTF TaxID=2170732 RepID=UPI000D5C4B05|nr:GIY-YIG nuclease family protein [Flavobacterium sp. HTF]PWB25935.1 endonuclease [Flavobacterium sp. HTF]